MCHEVRDAKMANGRVIVRALSLICLIVLSTVRAVALEVGDFTFSHLGKAEGLDNQRIFSICQSPSGAIWWSSMTGVGRYNGSNVRTYMLDQRVPYSQLGGRVIRLSIDSMRIFAFDNRGSIYRFTPTYDRFEMVASISRKLGYEVALNDIHYE